ncbi:MAG TPA: hypothetical protein VFT98_02925 [Myxococcota bacterium]|nr:hypothetical protein [Myxococcota bacterium]
MLDLKSSHRSRWRSLGAAGVSALALTLGAPPAEANHGTSDVCSQSANLLYQACRLDVIEESFETRAVCVNLADAEQRAECLDEIEDAREEAAEECSVQREARSELCDAIGEAPYDPDMDPALFQDPRNPSTPNPYFPLSVGSRWVFEEGDERIEIEVLDKTKRISGVDCIVVNDRAIEDGIVVEDTDDWFGLRTDGTAEYCGELSRDYELFEGDDPEELELVSIEGSFKAGVEGAKSGTIFLGSPVVGATYRQEWFAGEAEDVGTVLSTTYRYGEDETLDQAVPQALAELMCAAGDCIVVADTSTLEPDAFEHKFYARGVGLFLEVKPEDGEFVALVECNHDARCASLPLP